MVSEALSLTTDCQVVVGTLDGSVRSVAISVGVPVVDVDVDKR
jgi:hypothetical protein